MNSINNIITLYSAFKVFLVSHKITYFKNYLHSAYFWSWENSPGLRLTHFSWLVILAARVLVKYQKNIPFDPSDTISLRILIFSSQCLETGGMASVNADEVFDAMNCSQYVGSVASYSSVKRRSNIGSINISFVTEINVTDKYFLIHSFAQNLSIKYLPINSFICLSILYFLIPNAYMQHWQ